MNLMKRLLLLVTCLVLSTVGLSAQDRPVLVVNPFTTAAGVTWPYDMKVMHAQMLAEFKVALGKEFDVVSEVPASPAANVYTLDVEVTGWRAGNAAKRLVIGMGSGRESTDIRYRVTNASGQTVLELKDTVRTNFYSQAAGSVGTLPHPLAVKIAERVKDARLK